MPVIPTLSFLGLLAVLLVVDLGVLNRKAHAISAGQAFKQAAVWMLVASAFACGVYVLYEHNHFGLGLADQPPAPVLLGDAPTGPGPAVTPAEPPPEWKPDRGLPHNGREATLMFATAYLLELMLSLDNMMVIAIIMTYFKVPAPYQHRALFWGIIGAVVLRGAMIALGSELVHNFEWILYVFGAFLLASAIKLFFEKEDDHPDLERNWAVRITRGLLPVSPHYDGSRFLTRMNGALAITPLMLALITIDVADAIFAVDSIPAAFSATKDTFLVLTSNCFAILGLRAIYFAVAAITERFRFLKQSMILILAFIGIKMLLPLIAMVPTIRETGWSLEIGHLASLLVVAGLMVGGVVASVALPAAEGEATEAGESR